MPKKMKEETPKNIAIIGSGGSGLAAAWLGDSQSKLKVSVFEAGPRLGGHINTIRVGGIPVEAGAEFIGPESMYPLIHRIFRFLGVRLDRFDLSIDFHNSKTNKHLIFPPVYAAADSDEPGASSCFGCFGLFPTQKALKISFETLFTEFSDMIEVLKTIISEKNFKLQTLEQFAQEHFASEKGKAFAESILYPLIAAGWGFPIETVKKFMAHYALNYLVLDPVWYEAPGGLDEYIQKMSDQLSKRTQIHLNTPIMEIVSYKTKAGETKYMLKKADGSLVCDDKGKTILYDDVVLSTPAYVSSQLLKGVDSDHARALSDQLSKVEYIETTIAMHQDKRFLPPNKTTVVTQFDGESASNTACKFEKFAGTKVAPVGKTWVSGPQGMPKKLVCDPIIYHHPVMTKPYHDTECAIHETQGKEGIWNIGILGGYNDSHNSAHYSAYWAIRKICERENCFNPKDERFAAFGEVSIPVNATPRMNDAPIEHPRKKRIKTTASAVASSSNSTSAPTPLLSEPKPPRRKKQKELADAETSPFLSLGR